MKSSVQGNLLLTSAASLRLTNRRNGAKSHALNTVETS